MNEISPYFKNQLDLPVSQLEIEKILDDAKSLIKSAVEAGFILTIETVPDYPLAMGNYGLNIELRRSRGNYQ